jgi:hypothetical protein
MVFKKYWIHGLWLLSLPAYGWSGMSPDTYANAALRIYPSYPVRGVLAFIAVTTVELLVLYAIIRPSSYSRSWKRAAAGLLLFFPWLVVCAILLMHQPPYVFLHFLLLLLVNVILGGLCLFSMVSALTRQSTGQP